MKYVGISEIAYSFFEEPKICKRLEEIQSAIMYFDEYDAPFTCISLVCEDDCRVVLQDL